MAGGKLKITRDALDMVLHASRNTYPAEFIALLRKEKGDVIDIVLVIPQSTYGHGFSSVPLHNVPMYSNRCGSVHSHPNGNARPSRQDVEFFGQLGGVHLIVGWPYASENARGYDENGKEIGIEIVG